MVGYSTQSIVYFRMFYFLHCFLILTISRIYPKLVNHLSLEYLFARIFLVFSRITRILIFSYSSNSRRLEIKFGREIIRVICDKSISETIRDLVLDKISFLRISIQKINTPFSLGSLYVG